MTTPTLQVKRGLFVNLPALRAGEPGFTTDKYDLYLGTGAGTTASNQFYGSSRYWTRENGTNAAEFKFVDKNGTNGVSLRSPATVTTPVTYTLPEGGGTEGNFLKLGAAGVLEWSSGSAGASFSNATLSNTVLTGITTFSGAIDANAGLDVAGGATFDNINVTGIGTIATADINGGNIDGTVIGGSSAAAGTFTQLNYSNSSTSGISTVGSLYIGSDKVLSSEIGTLTLSNIEAIDATTKATLEASLALDPNNFDNLNVTGISSFTDTTNNTLGDTATGAVRISGGAGIAKNLTIGQSLNIQQNATILGIATISTGAVIDGVQIGINGANVIDTASGNLTLNSAGGTITVDDYLVVQNNAQISGDLNVNGRVTIGGTTLFLTSEDVLIQNKDIILGFTTSITPNDDTANHAGVAIASTVGSPLVSFTASGINTLPDTYKQMMWFKSGTLGFDTDAFAFNYGVAIGTTTMANGVRLAVGSGVTVSDTSVSATNFYGAFSGNASTATALQTARTIELTGDVAGSVVFDGTSNVSIAATIQPNSVGLGTDTTGDYVAGVSGTANQISVSGSGGETASVVLSLPNDVVVGTSLSVPTVKTATIQHSNGTEAITITSGGNVGVSTNLTVSGDLIVNGTTTQVNTISLTVEDTLVELGLVDGAAPTSDLSKDLGMLFNYYDGSAKKAAVYWDDSTSRITFASEVSEANSVLTASAYATVLAGGLEINNACTGGTDTVISCVGGELALSNIIVDGGSF